jgi:Flagellar Assembly Protein A N-terminal region
MGFDDHHSIVFIHRKKKNYMISCIRDPYVKGKNGYDWSEKFHPSADKKMRTMDTAATFFTHEQNMRLIDLAFDCVFINSPEKEKVIGLLEEKSKEDSEVNVTQIFAQENYISEKRIAYLLAFDEYLQTRSLDQQFGQLATANGMASEEAVAKALIQQRMHFEKNRIRMKIGDILLGNGQITLSDRVSILLTQNRIKNETLLDALNDLGETQPQKEAINKLFGVFAIKKELATIAQINAALDIQKTERQAQGESRFIGQILQETAGISDGEILAILLAQKQFEKRRLDLEKALYTVKSEIKISKKFNRFFEYLISKDGLEAIAIKQMKIDHAIPTYEFHIWLRRVGIKSCIATDAVLEDFIQTAQKKSQLIVAKGAPPEPPVNESIQFHFENELPPVQQNPDRPALNPSASENPKPAQEDPMTCNPEEEPPDTDEAENPLPIKKGSLLARIIPGKKGKSGKDVLGYPIQPDKPSRAVLTAGNHVIQKGLDFFARVDGRPVLQNGTTLTMEPVGKNAKIKAITGSITNDTQETYASLRVELKGTITKEAVFRCRSLLLHGHLLGQVICTGEIEVNGDIGTDETPTDPPTQILSQGSVKAANTIANSKIQTRCELLAFNSTVIGSEVIAFNGMAIRDCLTGKNGVSRLQCGLKPGDELLSVDHTIEEKRAKLACLKKEAEIRELTEKYSEAVKKEETRQCEQGILRNLIEMMKAPELYQYEGLENKIQYLNHLPKFSSIKACYLIIPETKTARALFDQIITATQRMSPESILREFQKKIDPEPEDQDSVSYRIEADFKGCLGAFEQEISDQSEAITQLENELKELQALRQKLGSQHLASPGSGFAIKIKNKCEKGTIIKGKIARLVVEKTLYNVSFKEVMGTHGVSISIEPY